MQSLPNFEQAPADATPGEILALRGDTHEVLFPPEDELRKLLMGQCLFLEFTIREDGTATLTYAVMLRLCSHAVIIACDVLKASDPAMMAVEPSALARALSSHFEKHLPKDKCYSLADWHALTWAHTVELINDEAHEAVKMTDADIFDFEPEAAQCRGGAYVEQRPAYTRSISSHLLCDEYHIPVGWDDFYAMGNPITCNQRASPRSAYSLNLSLLRNMTMQYSQMLATLAQSSENDTLTAPILCDFLLQTRETWTAARIGLFATQTQVMQAMEDRVKLKYGTTAEKHTVVSRIFDHIISQQVVFPAVTEIDDELGNPCSFTAATLQYRYPNMAMLFGQLATAQAFELYLEIAEHTGSRIDVTSTISLDRVEMLCLKHITVINAAEVSAAEKVQLLLRSEAREQALSNAPPARQVDGPYPQKAGADDPIFNTATMGALEQVFRSAPFVQQVQRLMEISTTEDPLWKKKFILEMVLQDPQDEHAEPILKSPFFAQYLWSQKVLNSSHHPIFTFVNEAREERDIVLSQFCVHGDDLGVDSTDVNALAFVFSQKFLQSFWKGNALGVHWHNDFVLPITNAWIKGTKVSPDPIFMPQLTVDRFAKTRKYLLRLVRFMGVDPTVERSFDYIMDTLSSLLEDAASMQGTPNGMAMTNNVQELFIKFMTAAMGHVSKPLLASDPNRILHKDMLPITASALMNYAKECGDIAGDVNRITRVLPHFQYGMGASHMSGAPPSGMPPPHPMFDCIY